MCKKMCIFVAPRDGWRQVMMLMHDDPNLASLKHSKRSYLTIDEYDYILNRLKTLS